MKNKRLKWEVGLRGDVWMLAPWCNGGKPFQEMSEVRVEAARESHEGFAVVCVSKQGGGVFQFHSAGRDFKREFRQCAA